MNRPPSQDLQPLALAIAACRRVWTERDELLRLGVAPLVLSFALNLWSWHLIAPLFAAIEAGATLDPAEAQSLMAPLFFVGAASWFLSSIFAVNWMRTMILGHASVRGIGIVLHRRHLKFVLFVIAAQLALSAAIAVIFIVAAMILPSPVLIAVLAFVLMGAFLVVMLRLAPIWVGIAIDAPMSIEQAWTRTAHYGLKMMVSVVLLGGLLLVAQSITQAFLGALGLLTAAPLASIFLFLMMQFVLTACVCTVLVIAYPRFVAETV